MNEINTENIECQGTEEVVCPHCGYEYSDSWEFHKNNNTKIGKITCDSCGMEFKCEGEYSVVYYCEKIKSTTPHAASLCAGHQREDA